MKKTYVMALLFVLFAIPVFSQDIEPDSTEIESLDEVLISSQRLGETRMHTSRQIEVITSKTIELAQQPTMGEVLSQTGQVFVQKSQLGGGSTVIRGFEASRVLLVIDGIRMNNATYRAGHLQDIVTIDPFMLDRAEIYFGSGSTLYGSDALGGVVYLKTKQPKFSDKLTFNPSALVRYASAGSNVGANIGWNLGNKNVAWLFNYSYNKFGDLRMGKGKNYSGIDTFGQRGYYVETIDGQDFVRKNAKPWIQKNSGYDQSDLMTKLSIKHGNWVSTLGMQASFNDAMPRYDRLNQTRNGTLRFAQWNYTPQNRYLASYTAEYKQNKNVQHRFIASAQRTEVGRQTRSLNKPVSLTQLDKVNMFALNYDNQIQLNSKLKLISGFEAVYNQVNSEAFYDSVKNGIRLTSKESRYADSFAHTFSSALFANVVYDILPKDFSINGGVRVSQYSAVAAFTKNNFWGIDFGQAKVQNIAPVFHLGAVKKVHTGLYVSLNLSTGFRNPNIDDLTKLFESIPGEKYIVPNKDLKPEKTQTFDFGLRYVLKDKLNIETGVYQTWVKNLLIDMPSQINGADSVSYGGQNTRVYQMNNAASGYVQGAYLGGKVKVFDDLYADFHYTVTYGRYKASEAAALQPLDHIAPDHGRLGLRYATGIFQAEAYMLFNGWKLAKDYSPSGEDNAAQAPAGRTPSWQTFNIRGSYQLGNKYALTLAVENILDLNYRVFASGISAPGRNISAAFRITL